MRKLVSKRLRPTLLCGVVAIVAVATLGCSSRVIRSSRLPDRYQAAAVTNAKVADLGRLSMPSASSSLIEPEDVVEVTIASGLETGTQTAATPVRVGDDGVATIALVGPVQVAGLEPFQAEQRIAAAAVERRLFRAPQVTVTMKKKAINRITVIGGVAKQGVQELPRSQSTLLDALVAAGSLNDKAGTKIEVRRHSAASRQMAAAATAGRDGDIQLASGNSLIRPLPVPGQAAPETVTIDLTDIDAAGRNNVTLQDGDVVRVETRDPTPISVIGLVNKPGMFDMPVSQPLHVLDALAMAGERSNSWADKIYITRHVHGENEPVVIETSVRQAQHSNESNIRLSPGDVVSVEKTPQTVVNSIFSSIFRFSIVAGQSVPLF